MISKNDVVSVVTLTGEFVGKYNSESTEQYIIDDPLLLTTGQQGPGFIPAVCMTGKQKPSQVAFNKASVCFIIETADEVQSEYRKNTSGLIV
jgi:hypothetical protein